MKRAVVLLTLLLLAGVVVHADTLEMKDGRLLKGKYMGGSQFNIRFEENGKVNAYPLTDVLTLTIDPRSAARPSDAPDESPVARPERGFAQRPPSTLTVPADTPTPTSSVSVPAGTRLMVRMIDGIDSDTAHVGDRFHASLLEDLDVDGTLVAPKDTDVYGRLTDAKEAGRIEGRSELRVELTELMLNGKAIQIHTGDYQVSGKSRGADTAKKAVGGAAIGGIIGAIAGGGKGAAIGAGVGGAAGAGTQVFTHGQKVKIPSETVLDFTLQDPFVAPVAPR